MRQNHPNRFPVFSQQLEPRRLLSAVVNNRVLTVTGTDNGEAITLIRQAGATASDPDMYVVTVGADAQQFFEADVDYIIVNGMGGADSISLVGTVPAAIHGGDGNDTIVGSSNSETFYGDAGNDSILGGKGQDTLNGGVGDDFLSGGSGSDYIVGGKGNDTLEGTSGHDYLRGEGGFDLLNGGSGDDTIDGGIRADTFNGNSGNDVIFASDVGSTTTLAADVLSGGSGARDQIIYSRAVAGISLTLDGIANDGYPGEGDNVASDFEIFNGSVFNDFIDVSTRAGRLTIVGGAGNDTLIGGRGADVISGQEGNDSITGSPGEDRIFGGADNDTLIANDGFADILNGGSGTDSAIGDSGLDSMSGIEA